eukprot:scaffold5357_cov208-Amphora_coffeaeformis.AAC.4
MMRLVFFLFSLLTAATAWTPDSLPRAILHKVAKASAGATLVAVTLATSSPVSAKQDVTQGQQLFQADCASCHAAVKKLPGDQTLLNRDALGKYRDLDENKIKDFLQNRFPHNVMPFAIQYSDNDYADVSGYVLEQALNNQKP